MKNREYHARLDYSRLIAALMIVGIHTYPLSSVSEELNFYITHVFARIAVPFFLITTGYFLLPLYFTSEAKNKEPLKKFIKKVGLLYAGATLLYLPVNIYAGHYADGNVLWDLIKIIVFDGTFYHLWYFPALIVGVLLIYLLSRKFSIRVVGIITGLLYLLGLLGDSYYGITIHLPFLDTVYTAMFSLFSYTRNGLFYTPIFLLMGVVIATWKQRPGKMTSFIGFMISMLVMLSEGAILHRTQSPRHDSMYIALIPCVFFLFCFLLSPSKGVKTHRSSRSIGAFVCNPHIRDISLWIYVLHPFIIVLVRGVSTITGFTSILVENSVIHYLMVSLLSCVSSIMMVFLLSKLKSISTHHPDETKNPDKTRAWIELDLENLRHNISILREKIEAAASHPTPRLMAVVKANAYGHGAVRVANELNKNGIFAFAVATVSEGVELRKHKIKGEILILGYTHPTQFYLLRKYRLLQTVIDYNYAQKLNEYGKQISKKQVFVHIKVDTGMNRLGERSEDIDRIIGIFQLQNLQICGIYTHLSTLDSHEEKERVFVKQQADEFTRVLSQIKEYGYTIPPRHLLTSYGVFNHPDLMGDYARVGIALYGMLSRQEDTDTYNTGLRPVMSLKARVSAVKMLPANATVGYGFSFRAMKEMKIAIISIGYADGIPRCYSSDGSLSCGNGYVLVNGHKAPTLGNICMDMMIVDVSEIDDVDQGDIAVIIGKSGGLEITACEIAAQTNTIANEILSRLGERLARC
ncbi:MAG: serine racemase VanT catalytic subunit [Lachnospiraceae bacterium]|jgi:serine/alanine racemase|nr:serine racemase VanT catalytic subunit [Lachnospiraceae bacterium]